MTNCRIEVMEYDSFSNMQQLCILDLNQSQIQIIEKNAFSNLKKLEKLNLSYNKLTKVDREFIGLSKLVDFKQ